MTMTPIPAFDLQPFDVLLYRPSGLFGRAIQLHTGQPISHVEVVLGRELIAEALPGELGRLDAQHGAGTVYATASRDRLGVDFYPVRLDRTVAYQLRPRAPWPLPRGQQCEAVRYAAAMRGTPYGYLDLLSFFGFRVNGPGVVCSPYATAVLRKVGIALFNGIQARQVNPAMYRSEPALGWLWTDGRDQAIDAEGL